MIGFLVGCTLPATDDGGKPETGATGDSGAAPEECPFDPAESDTECSECLDEKCSDLLPFCDEDPDCACMEQCLRQEGMGGVDACLESLGLAYRPVGFAQLEECVAYACPDRDECSTPADWTPPDAEIECDGAGTGGLGGGTDPDCAFDAGLAYDPDGDVLQLVNVEGDFCVRIERTSDGAGTLENVSWTLDALRIGPLGDVAHVDDSSDLCWYSSHHNFQDWAHAWTGSRRHDLGLKEDGHGGPRRYHLYVFEEGPLEAGECGPTDYGTGCIEGPIALYAWEP